MKQDPIHAFICHAVLPLRTCLKPVMRLSHLCYGTFLAKPPEWLIVGLKRDGYNFMTFFCVETLPTPSRQGKPVCTKIIMTIIMAKAASRNLLW